MVNELVIFSFFFAEALSRLDVVIRHPNAQHSENIMAYDNAVSALGKICQFHRDSINAPQVQVFVSSHEFLFVSAGSIFFLVFK